MLEGGLVSKKSNDFSFLASKAEQRLRSTVCGVELKTILLLLAGFPLLLAGVHLHGQKAAYFLRPLLRSPPKPFTLISHYHHPNLSLPLLCSLHGWRPRSSPRRVFDAVLFNNELDILDLRWRELLPFVSEFVLLESNSTFTGIIKPLFFDRHRHRFHFVESKLTYGTIGGRFVSGENPFVEESYQRVALDQLIRIAGIEEDDLLIMSDTDEIPSRITIDLLRWCDGSPEKLHLQLKNYMYSFEFLKDDKSWRASVHHYRPGTTRYAHYRQSDVLLADAGWHCSFCFRYIEEFVFKMKAYSHADRVRFKHFLDPARIQDKICEGADLFDMLPEEHTFRELVGKMGPIPRSYSAVHLPGHLVLNTDQFKYLLPGNCIRENSDS